MAFSQILKIKIRDIHIVERKNSIGIGVFGYENKESMYQKNVVKKNIDLLLMVIWGWGQGCNPPHPICFPLITQKY